MALKQKKGKLNFPESKTNGDIEIKKALEKARQRYIKEHGCEPKWGWDMTYELFIEGLEEKYAKMQTLEQEREIER